MCRRSCKHLEMPRLSQQLHLLVAYCSAIYVAGASVGKDSSLCKVLPRWKWITFVSAAMTTSATAADAVAAAVQHLHAPHFSLSPGTAACIFDFCT